MLILQLIGNHVLKKVAIIGRPNVGKSTLFNRLAVHTRAIVDDRPGVTRDWKESPAQLADLHFTIVDTAGLEGYESEDVFKQILRQTDHVIERADIILFMIDGLDGVLSDDIKLAEKLRCLDNKHVIVIINKAENTRRLTDINAIYRLGLGEPILFSAAHGLGIDPLYDVMAPILRPKAPADQDDQDQDGSRTDQDNDYIIETIDNNDENIDDHDDTIFMSSSSKDTVNSSSAQHEQDNDPLSIVVIGRPNAGKSTLINKLVGEDRLIASDQPGITRDAITLDWQWQGRAIQLVDTAGVRRRARVDDQLERASVRDAMQAVRYAHVVILLVDARSPLDKQDLLLASKVIEEGRCLVIGLNKWDIADPLILKQVQHTLETSLSQVRGLPCIPISAKNGRNIDKLMKAVTTVYKQWNKRLSTARLNQWLNVATERHPTPLIGNYRIRLKYITQIKTRPPTFVIFVSKPAELPESYNRYLIGSLQQNFDFYGVPIRLLLRKNKNPYIDSK